MPGEGETQAGLCLGCLGCVCVGPVLLRTLCTSFCSQLVSWEFPAEGQSCCKAILSPSQVCTS